MDCSICMEAITKQTGSTVLSCDHAFHFRCIDEWFYKQLCEGLHQTCPCCRSEGAELDRCMYEEATEDEEDDDEESYEEDDDEVSEAGSLDEFAERIWNGSLRLERNAQGQWVIIDTQDMAFDSLRTVFGPLNELDVEESSEEIAARKIQAIYRGYQERSAFAMKRAVHVLIHLSRVPQA
jgi:hypothetical protein